jgi:hypothetical protein
VQLQQPEALLLAEAPPLTVQRRAHAVCWPSGADDAGGSANNAYRSSSRSGGGGGGGGAWPALQHVMTVTTAH